MSAKRNKGKNSNYVTDATKAKHEAEIKEKAKKENKFVKTMLKSSMFRNLARSKEVRVMVYVFYAMIASIVILVLIEMFIK